MTSQLRTLKLITSSAVASQMLGQGPFHPRSTAIGQLDDDAALISKVWLSYNQLAAFEDLKPPKARRRRASPSNTGAGNRNRATLNFRLIEIQHHVPPWAHSKTWQTENLIDPPARLVDFGGQTQKGFLGRDGLYVLVGQRAQFNREGLHSVRDCLLGINLPD